MKSLLLLNLSLHKKIKYTLDRSCTSDASKMESMQVSVSVSGAFVQQVLLMLLMLRLSRYITLVLCIIHLTSPLFPNIVLYKTHLKIKIFSYLRSSYRSFLLLLSLTYFRFSSSTSDSAAISQTSALTLQFLGK